MAKDATQMIAAIERLVASPEWEKLLALEPAFDLFEAVGTTLNEQASSRALAYLLDSRNSHGLGTRLLQAWLRHIHHEQQAAGGRRIGLQDLLGFNGTRTAVTTEWATSEKRRIDLLIKVYREDNIVGVIGVENKHWAGEQKEQVSHYQAELSQHYPKARKLLLFLNPEGRAASTGDKGNQDCPWADTSYRPLLDALDDTADSAGGDVAIFARSLRSHLGAHLLETTTMDRKAERLVHALYQDPEHRKAILFISQHIPTWGGICERITDECGKRLKRSGVEVIRHETLTASYFPKQKRELLQEIKLWPVSLADATGKDGWTLTYMLRSEQAGPDIGDEIKLLILGWSSDKKQREGIPGCAIRQALPEQENEGTSWYWSWEFLWGGGKYRLQDLGERDVQGCADLFERAVEKTYPALHALLVGETKQAHQLAGAPLLELAPGDDAHQAPLG